MAGEYVFNLMRVTKQYNKVTVLDDIQLAFFFGAKIGVIGGNGSGKSSLCRKSWVVSTRNSWARRRSRGT